MTAKSGWNGSKSLALVASSSRMVISKLGRKRMSPEPTYADGYAAALRFALELLESKTPVEKSIDLLRCTLISADRSPGRTFLLGDCEIKTSAVNHENERQS